MGPQRIVVARGFVEWLRRSGEMSVNDRTLKEASRQTETSVQFLWAVVVVYAPWERSNWSNSERQQIPNSDHGNRA
ncbi:hypothetical protein AVEN_118918-1 [Araneus ventricosus]|uniref:Uncharacterized protein n=1 Tax=Araneus ventricosus TaxID=182803 RepID=A0A4Y2BXW9_ARAVE|nr:hypothetical protein AVEN_118918-1 [Araneus ventricosus]